MKTKTLPLATAVRVAVCLTLICVFLFFELASAAGFGTAVHSPTWWALCAFAAIVFLVTSRSWEARVASGLTSVVCLLVAACELPYFLPMQQRVGGVVFSDATMQDVLRALSEQRQAKPYRRFIICDKDTLNERITLSIPDGCTLGEALEMIASATDSEYDWHWYSWCGNTYPPTTAKIYFYAAGGTMTKGLWEIDRNRQWRRDENFTLLCDPDGELTPSLDLARETN